MQKKLKVKIKTVFNTEIDIIENNLITQYLRK